VLVVSDDVEQEISGAAYGRRTFLRRLALGSAFAVPVVSSFSMAGIKAVSAQANPGTIGNCNQTSIYTGNQTVSDDLSIYNQNQGYGQPQGPFCNPNQGYGQPPGPPILNQNQTQQEGLIGFLEEIFELFTGHRPPKRL
jgi:hypothetical protein